MVANGTQKGMVELKHSLPDKRDGVAMNCRELVKHIEDYTENTNEDSDKR